jgi:PadR family transcriptional regulator, regulatory protein AphA
MYPYDIFLLDICLIIFIMNGGVAMAKINKTKYAILGVLRLAPGSGYDIKKFCDFSISHFWNENYGHIYPVLKQMEIDGMVNKTTEHNEGRPDRNVYFINEKGEEELRNWLLLPVDDEPPRIEILLKLFFSMDAPVENTVNKILHNKSVNEDLLAKLMEVETFLQSDQGYKDNPGLPLWLSTINYGKYHARATIAWCEETLALLRKVE